MTQSYDIGPAGPLLKVSEVANQLRVSKRTVNRLVKRGSFPLHSKVGGQWRIPQADVDAYLARDMTAES